MKFERSSGILLHPTSLPGPYGIGDLGPKAYQWVDWLAGCGCKLWQILPLGPTGYGNSPYQTFSAFAGNPYLISPELLLKDDLLQKDDLVEIAGFNPRRVDYGAIIPWKLNLLERAFKRYTSRTGKLGREHSSTFKKDFDYFCTNNNTWLEDYALFMAIKEAQGGVSWTDWPNHLRERDKGALRDARKSLAASITRFIFYQFIFYRQWHALRNYANEKGLQIIGDIPIFVALDCSDVWTHPDLFYLDEDLEPTVVAGVPPDYFSSTGQLWGNPLYRWVAHRKNGYAWWLERLRSTLNQVDILRIDHFRGFIGYWEVPAGNPTAEVGRWMPGPGADFFQVVVDNLGKDLPIIAEDLGVITPGVTKLRDRFKLPGMKVLQFGFTGPGNPFLPHSYPTSCVVYTGTHDNDTSRGWFETAPDKERDFALRYLAVNGEDFSRDLIREAWKSTAVMSMAPLQDFLGLGSEARFNYPSRLGGNWEWRFTEDELSNALQKEIKELNWLYQR